MKIAVKTRNAAADAVGPLLDNGVIRFFDGVQPADPDVAITTQVQLAELGLGNPALQNAVNGQKTFNAITADSSADATGTATWARFYMQGATDPADSVLDMTVTAIGNGGDIEMDNINFIAGGNISISSLVLNMPIG